MKFRCLKRTAFLLCFLGLLKLASCYGSVLNRESKGEGIFQDQIYDDPIGEFTGQQRRSFAFGPVEDSENNDVSEDESENDVKTIGSKEWLLEAIDKHRRQQTLKENDADSELIQGETEADRLALLREEKKNEMQEKAAKKREKEKTEDDIPTTGRLFEGDIVMSDHFRAHLTGKNAKRDALVDKDYLWEKKDGKVRVPYSIDENFNSLKRERLKEAISDFIKYTCIKFVPKEDDDKDSVHFFSNKSMCYSSVGKQGGRQKISIGDGCERKGTVIHEMLHSIGFIHEQSRPDRDDYVDVLWENIKKGLTHNFKKYPNYLVDNLGVEYDFDSVLHYHNKAFSNNGEDTLRDIKDPSRKFGQRYGFSIRNIKQVNKLYGCEVDPSVMADVKYE